MFYLLSVAFTGKNMRFYHYPPVLSLSFIQSRVFKRFETWFKNVDSIMKSRHTTTMSWCLMNYG